MSSFKKLVILFSFNLLFLSILFIGIQNNSNKSKVNFIFDETIELPLGFIIGTSFILGSLTGSLLIFDQKKRN